VTPRLAPPDAKADLDHRGAVHDVVVHFYREIVFDDLLDPVFGEVAEVDWAVHIPKLIDYWCRVLLGEHGYAGAIHAAHRHVHDIEAFRPEHFDRWYSLWVASVDAGWEGPFAERAKRHAARVATSLARQLVGAAWQPPLTDTPTERTPT
jgi:hemoglobin